MERYKILLSIALLSLSIAAFAQYDDIYFNPKTDIKKKVVTRPVVVKQEIEESSNDFVSDDYISLTEEDYTYTKRIKQFQSENLLVHIEGNDTTIYDMEDGSYLVTLDGDAVDISAYDYSENNATNVYVNVGNDYYWNDAFFWWGWNVYDPWYWNSYVWHRPWYYHDCYCCTCHNSWHHQHHVVHHYSGDVSRDYMASSNETYRLQHNSEGRFAGVRSVSSSSVGRNASTNAQSSGRSAVVRSSNEGESRTSVTRTPTSTSQQGSTQVVRVSSSTSTSSSSRSSSNQSSSNTRVSTSTSTTSRQANTSSSTRTSTSNTYSGGRSSGVSSSSSTRTSGSSSSGGRNGGSYSGGASGGGTRTPSGGGRR